MLAVLDSRADLSSIHEPVLTQWESCLPGVQVSIPLQAARTVPLATGGVVSVKHKRILLQLSINTSWGTVVLDTEGYACTG